MSEIRVQVHTMSGDVHAVEVPVDMSAADFIKELVAGLDLPRIDAEGNAVSWIIDNKDTAKTMDYESSLERNGVCAGHHLYLRRQVVAGR